MKLARLAIQHDSTFCQLDDQQYLYKKEKEKQSEAEYAEVIRERDNLILTISGGIAIYEITDKAVLNQQLIKQKHFDNTHALWSCTAQEGAECAGLYLGRFVIYGLYFCLCLLPQS